MAAAALMLLFLLAGCSPVKVGEAGQTAWLWKSPKGGEFLVGACPQTISAAECSKLPKVELTANPQDREAWQFERRVKIRALIGIPYGRQPVDVMVVGPRTWCEGVAAPPRGSRGTRRSPARGRSTSAPFSEGLLTCQRVSPPALDSQGQGFEGPLDDGAVAERAGLPVTVLGPLLRNQHHGFHRCLPFYPRVFSTVTEIPLGSLASPVG